MKRSLNIALMGNGFSSWGGGTDFLRILANSLLSLQNDRQVRLFLLLPIRNKADSFTKLREVIRKTAARMIRKGRFSLSTREPVLNSTLLDFCGNIDGLIEPIEYSEMTDLITILRKIEADVVMPLSSPLGQSFPFPWVGYIYDFQHKYLPDYFSARECLSRDIHFATMLRDAKAVIVNSRSVKDDIDKFFPYCDCEIFNLPFSAAPVSSWLEEVDRNIPGRYDLPPRYFLISNQFFIHKSHSTAFQALAMLRNNENCADLHIVCTGKMNDPRFPDHNQKLQQEVRDLAMEGKIHLLGHIPKIDQIAIMMKSLAVLQPTLFEGGPGGGSVYDAVSLGVPVIVSDILVNKEIKKEENLFYFKAGSATDLAEKIKEFLKKDIRRTTKEELILRGEQRKQLMGNRLLEAIRYVMKKPAVN